MKNAKIITTLIAILMMVSNAWALPPYEQDDIPQHARPFRVNDDIQTKDFDKVSDEDWAIFPLINGQRYRIVTEDLAPNNPPYEVNGTYIEIYDGSILDDPDAVPLYCDEGLAF